MIFEAMRVVSPKSLANLQPRPRQPAGRETKTVSWRLEPEHIEALEQLAAQHGCIFRDKAHVPGLLAKIAKGEILLALPLENRK